LRQLLDALFLLLFLLLLPDCFFLLSDPFLALLILQARFLILPRPQVGAPLAFLPRLFVLLGPQIRAPLPFGLRLPFQPLAALAFLLEVHLVAVHVAHHALLLLVLILQVAVLVAHHALLLLVLILQVPAFLAREASAFLVVFQFLMFVGLGRLIRGHEIILGIACGEGRNDPSAGAGVPASIQSIT
jgi:hypothetical protein